MPECGCYGSLRIQGLVKIISGVIQTCKVSTACHFKNTLILKAPKHISRLYTEGWTYLKLTFNNLTE